MGFDPHRKFRAKPVDYAMVAVALLVVVGLVLWTALG